MKKSSKLIVCFLSVTLTACSSTRTVKTGQAECPNPRKLVIDDLSTTLFPKAPAIQILPAGTDTVYAASVIRASRDLTKQYNDGLKETVSAANGYLSDSVASYNGYLDKREASCAEPAPKKPKRRWPWQ